MGCQKLLKTLCTTSLQPKPWRRWSHSVPDDNSDQYCDMLENFFAAENQRILGEAQPKGVPVPTEQSYKPYSTSPSPNFAGYVPRWSSLLTRGSSVATAIARFKFSRLFSVRVPQGGGFQTMPLVFEQVKGHYLRRS